MAALIWKAGTLRKRSELPLPRPTCLLVMSPLGCLQQSVPGAANGSWEPRVTDAAQSINGRLRFITYIGRMAIAASIILK